MSKTKEKKRARRQLALQQAAPAPQATKANGHDPEAIQVDRPIVALLTPCYKVPHPRMQHAFYGMTAHARENGIVLFTPPLIQSSVVHWTRNSLLRDLLKSQRPFTHVLFLDDDIVVAADTLVRLVAHNVDIVAALCTKRQDPPIPNARIYNEETGEYHEMWEWPDGLIEVGAVGTGVMLVTLNALQKVADVYFKCLYEQKVFGMPADLAKEIGDRRWAEFDTDPNAWWFKFHCKENGVGEYGEDIAFCHIARRFAGLKVHVDTTIQPEHMGDYGFSIKDFIAHREPLIEQAKRQGKYLAFNGVPPKHGRYKIELVEG